MNVGMFGRSFDLITYFSESMSILICECTPGKARKKSSTLKKELHEVSSEMKNPQLRGVVFTPQIISKTDRKGLADDEITVIDGDDLLNLYEYTGRDSKPGLLEDLLVSSE